jgi:hypothetical protein
VERETLGKDDRFKYFRLSDLLGAALSIVIEDDSADSEGSEDTIDLEECIVAGGDDDSE